MTRSLFPSGRLLLCLGVALLLFAPDRTTHGDNSAGGAIVHVAVIRAGSSVSNSTANTIRAQLEMAMLEKFSGRYRMLLDADARLVVQRAWPYLNGDCSTLACLARLLRVLRCDEVIQGDVRREGDGLRLALRKVGLTSGGKARVLAQVNFVFPRKRMHHFIRQTVSALMIPGYRMVMNPGPAFEAAVEIKSPRFSEAVQFDARIFRFKSLNPAIVARLPGWKDRVLRADQACERDDCGASIQMYRAVQASVERAVPVRDHAQMKSFLGELDVRLAAAYVRFFARRLRETDREVWGNRIADLKQAVNRYGRLEDDILALKPRYRLGTGPIRTAIVERKKLVPLVVSRTFEKLGDVEYRGYRFDNAQEFFRRGIAAAALVRDARSDERIRHLRDRIELTQAVRRSYVANRINILLSALPRFREPWERPTARKIVHRARKLLYREGAEIPGVVQALNRAATDLGLPARTAHTLTIQSDVQGARVTMNGRPMGNIPVERKLLQGSYLITLESKGYRRRVVRYSHKADKVLEIPLGR